MSPLEEGFGVVARRITDKHGYAAGVAWWISFTLLASLPIAGGLYLLGVPLDYGSVKTYLGLAVIWLMFNGG